MEVGNYKIYNDRSAPLISMLCANTIIYQIFVTFFPKNNVYMYMYTGSIRSYFLIRKHD